MLTPDLVRTLDAALAHLETCADELRDLDAALGDGDLGITVSAGSRAARTSLDALDDAALPADVLKAVGAAFATANPSTMGALVGGALLAAARVLGERTEVDVGVAVEIGRVAAESIATRGKTQLGDKTVLDALVPALDAIEITAATAAGTATAVGTAAPFDAAVAAARHGVESTRELPSKRGRAAWLGDRSKGLQDPGATALLRFLEGLHPADPAGTSGHRTTPSA